jgi:type 1 glutamine amidotransferase
MNRGVVQFAIRFLSLLAAAGLVFQAVQVWAGDEDGFTPIFNGKTLDGWDGNPELWSVEEGAITGKTSAEDPLKVNQFIIWRQGKLDDFVLRFQYRLIGGNSGVQYRSWEDPDKWGKWVVGGYQADFASNEKYTGILYGERYRGILALRGQKVVIGDNHKPKVVEQFADEAELQKHIKMEDWNDYQVTAKGHQITHVINGHKMIEALDEDTEQRRRSGILAFQVHVWPTAMKVQMRNIRLKRLPMEDTKKIVLLAGLPSHGYGAHEHNAGCLLLAKWLNECVDGVHAVVYRNGWPKDPTALDNADAVVIFCNGGSRHLAMGHLEEIDRLMKKGVGLSCLHYAVEIPKGKPGDYLLDWTGGYFETDWSVNPHWSAKFTEFPDHPVARGLKPFEIDDEWYYHMRFPENMKNVTPILTAIPPDSTRERPDGPHSNNPTVRARKGMPEHVAWVVERPDGGRGFGFTGGHWQWNWANDSYRKAVLNAIVWSAGLEIPANGVESPKPTMEELEANQDYQPKKNFDRQKWVERLEEWKQE